MDWMAASDIENPKRENVIQWKDHMKATRSLGTAQTYLTAVKAFFRFLEQENLYRDITVNIRGVHVGNNPKKDPLTVEQVLTVLAKTQENTSGNRDYAIILLMVTCGLRISEIARANIGDFHWSGNSLLLSIHGKGKDGKTEFVPVPGITAQAINHYLNTRKRADENSPLFVSQSNNHYGRRISPRSISRMVKQTFMECGLCNRRLTAHSLRHTAITLSLIAGSSLQEAQQFARHSLITTTQIYAHNLEHVRNPCADRVAEALFPQRSFAALLKGKMAFNQEGKENIRL